MPDPQAGPDGAPSEEAAGPLGIHVPRHLELRGRTVDLHARRLVLLLFAALAGLALAGVFGQQPSDARASSQAATLTVTAPTRVRGGLLFMARIRVDAHRELKRASLVLDPGWLESMQVNTIEPSPLGEASRDGRLVLTIGHVPAGQKHVLYVEFQVDPTNVGSRATWVRLEDSGRELVAVHRDITVFP